MHHWISPLKVLCVPHTFVDMLGQEFGGCTTYYMCGIPNAMHFNGEGAQSLRPDATRSYGLWFGGVASDVPKARCAYLKSHHMNSCSPHLFRTMVAEKSTILAIERSETQIPYPEICRWMVMGLDMRQSKR